MKILYISDSTIPSFSANSIHVMKMCQAWSKQGHEVILLGKKTNAGLQDINDIFEFYGVEPTFKVKLFPWKSFFGSGRVYNLLLPFFTFKRYDFVYTRAIYPAFWYALFGKKISFEIHEPFDTKGKWLFFLFNYIVNSGSIHKWIVISQPIKNYLQDKFNIPGIEILVAHDGADEVARGIVKLDNLPIGFNVGYVGSLLQGKGMEIIFKLSKELPKVNFHIVGGKEEQVEHWKEQMKKGHDNLIFHGFVDHSKTTAYLTSFDLLIAPYLRQVFVKSVHNSNNIALWMSPLKIFEYMSARKPILTSDLPVIREVLENKKSALLCEPEDTQQWVEAILLVISNKVLASEISDNAYLTFIQKYTWYKRAEKILNFIR